MDSLNGILENYGRHSQEMKNCSAYMKVSVWLVGLISLRSESMWLVRRSLK